MRPLALHWKILIGLVLGMAAGIAVNRAGSRIEDLVESGGPLAAWLAGFIANLVWFVGDLFLRALRFIAVPIVFFSLVGGAASLGDLRQLGRIGGRTVGIYLFTTAVAVVVGLTIANLVKPGSRIDESTRLDLGQGRLGEVQQRFEQTGDVPTLWEQLLDMVPQNPFEALATASMLQVIVFALAIGVGLTMIPREKAAPVLAIFDAMTDVVVRLVHIIMWLAPYAVFALMARAVATMGLDVLRSLVIYTAVVAGGLALLVLVEYPILLRLFAGVGFVRFFRAMAPAQLLAFSTSSSSATLPVTMRCARERLGVSDQVTSFVCPLGATINMDGTALYQGAATVFIAQLYGIPLPIQAQFTILLTAVLASIGTPGIPGAGVVMLIIVLESVNIPADAIAGGIAVILAVDRLLDMCRTVVNVSGDAMTAAIVARFEGEPLIPPSPAAAAS